METPVGTVASPDLLKTKTEKLSLLNYLSQSELLEGIHPDCQDIAISLMDSVTRIIEQIQ
jgi:hypothetical protein